jgi:hypothetical protein
VNDEILTIKNIAEHRWPFSSRVPADSNLKQLAIKNSKAKERVLGFSSSLRLSLQPESGDAAHHP